MILNQYYHALRVMATGASVSMTSTQASTYNSFSVSSMYKLLQLSAAMGTLVTNNYTQGVVLGTSGTTPNIADYCLKGTILTTLSGSGKVTKSHSDGVTTITSVLTFTNTGNAEITVNEIGLQMNYTGNWNFMVDRTVLDSPLVIPANGVGQITYTIKLVYPTE